MKIILAIFEFLVLAVYFLFLWDAILGIKYKLFNLDDDDEDTSFLFNVIYVAYTFFNLIVIMKIFHL